MRKRARRAGADNRYIVLVGIAHLLLPLKGSPRVRPWTINLLTRTITGSIRPKPGRLFIDTGFAS
jgi:hypothetical protein